eukprot:TRINITY_DN33249_c0_g1_i1.p1 TRINITY_DN33249_c0_g1~~TRINITY_DN33249_c0_g1_i1.p1  ORF type:complete len:117 (+),score=18.03 TRINITY_DN33249_c0_g1_i1:113-463(+)
MCIRDSKWQWSECLVFADQLLSWVRSSTQDGQRYTMSYDPTGGNYNVHIKVSELEGCFVPQNFREHLRRLQESAGESSREGAAKRVHPEGGSEQPSKRVRGGQEQVKSFRCAQGEL